MADLYTDFGGTKNCGKENTKVCDFDFIFDDENLCSNNKNDEKYDDINPCEESNEIIRNDTEQYHCSLSLSSLASTNGSYSYGEINAENNLLSIACANARSLVEKIDSLITLFEECNLHATLVTETWLSPKHCPPRTMSDLTRGADLNFIRRDRGRRGGGVAIAYNPTRIRLVKFSSYNNTECEMVCATGSCPLTNRRIALLAVYLPPALAGAALARSLASLVDCVDKVKTKFPDSIITVGGDSIGRIWPR